MLIYCIKTQTSHIAISLEKKSISFITPKPSKQEQLKQIYKSYIK